MPLDRKIAAGDAQVSALCDQIAGGRSWIARKCMQQAAREKLAWMLNQVDLFCSRHVEDQGCAETQRDAMVRLYWFREAHPLIKPEKCLTSSQDEHGAVDLDKVSSCLVDEAAIL
jgi:hypothetical protein